MVSGKIVVIFENDGAALPIETEYGNRIAQAFNKILTSYDANDLDFQYVGYGKTQGENFNLYPSVFPTLYFQIDGENATILTGYRSVNELYTFFYANLKGKAKETGGGTDPTDGSGFGLNPDGYAYTRKCNPVDDFLKWLKLGEGLKRGIYGVGAAFFAYNTLRSPNTLIMSVNGGISAGFLYLFFGKEDCPFDIPTLESNAKTIAIGGAAGLALLLGYQFYLKPTIQERRIKRIVRAARGDDKPKSTTAAQRSTTRKKPKSVTVTKRF